MSAVPGRGRAPVRSDRTETKTSIVKITETTLNQGLYCFGDCVPTVYQLSWRALIQTRFVNWTLSRRYGAPTRYFICGSSTRDVQMLPL